MFVHFRGPPLASTFFCIAGILTRAQGSSAVRRQLVSAVKLSAQTAIWWFEPPGHWCFYRKRCIMRAEVCTRAILTHQETARSGYLKKIIMSECCSSENLKAIRLEIWRAMQSKPKPRSYQPGLSGSQRLITASGFHLVIIPVSASTPHSDDAHSPTSLIYPAALDHEFVTIG